MPASRLYGVEERFPGELETLRADRVRLRRLLELSEEQARAADPDQAAWVAPSVALGTDKSRRATPMQMLRDS